MATWLGTASLIVTALPAVANADGNKPPEPPGQAKKHHDPGVTIPDLAPRPTLDKKLPPGPTGSTAPSADATKSPATINGPTTTSPDPSPATKHRAAEATGIAAARKAGKPTAVPELTTDTSTTVANPDGTLTASIAPGPVRTDINGSWQPIDTTLAKAADGTLKPKAATVQVSLSGGGDGPLASVARGGKKTTITWPLGPLPTPEVDGANATYPQVLPGVDLRVSATADGIREVLIVTDAKAAANPALQTLRFGITGDGLTMKTTDSGGLSAVDERGRQVFTGPAPQMWDSSGTEQSVIDATAAGSAQSAANAGSPGVADEPRHGAKSAIMPLRITGGSATLVPDQSLLTDPGTKYPVYIDPTIGGGNYQCVQIYKGNSSYSENCDSYMRAGYDPAGGSIGAVRSLFSFDVVTPLTTNNPYNGIPGHEVYDDPALGTDNITKAELKLTVHNAPSCPFNQFDVYRTGPINGPVTWNNAVTDNTNGIWGQQAILLTQPSPVAASSCGDGATLPAIDDTSQVQSVFANAGHNNSSPYATLGVRMDQENNSAGTYWSFYFANAGTKSASLNITYRPTPYVVYGSLKTTPPISFNGPVDPANPQQNCRTELNNADGVQSLPTYGGPPPVIGYIGKNFANQITLHASIGDVDPITAYGQFQFADVTNVQQDQAINFGQVLPPSPDYYHVVSGGPAGTTDPSSIHLGAMDSTVITQNNNLYPLIDGHIYRYSTYVFDPATGNSFTEDTEACYFMVAFKAPQAPSAIDGGDFPGLGNPSKPGMYATLAGRGITFKVDTDGVNIDHFEYVIDNDSAAIPSTQSGFSCTNTASGGCLPATPTGSGNAGISATTTVPIPAGVTTMGTNTVWIRAVDRAGNVSPVGIYQFYLPGNPHAVATLGDITGDGVPDILAVEPGSGNNARLMTFPGNTDPNLLGSNLNNAIEAAPAAAAPDGVSWANTVVTHRGALRGVAVDDLFAYSKTNQSLYYYLNSNIFGGTVKTDMYALNRKVLITRPTCTPTAANGYCGGGSYAPDWSHVSQILAFGNAAGAKPGNFAGRTNLITVEDDGNHHASVWMFSPGPGLGQLTNPILLSKDNSSFNWLDTDLIAPGINPGGTLPNLWARDRTTGNLWQITNAYDRNNVEDPSSLGNMANAATIGAAGGYDMGTYTTLVSAGSPASAGDLAQTGYPALWDIEPNGTLRMLPGSANGPLTPVNGSWPTTRNSWTNVNNITSVDGSPVTMPAGPILLGEGQTSGNPQLCVDLQHGTASPNTIVWNYTCNGQASQDWVINSDGTIRYGADLTECLEVATTVPQYAVLTPDHAADGNYGANAGTMDHAPVQLNTCAQSGGLPAANQQWVLRPSAGAASHELHGWYDIYNPNSARCLENGNGSTSNAQQLWITTCGDTQAQQFQAPAAAGTWMFISAGAIAPWGTAATAPTSVSGDTYTLNGTVGSSYGLNWYVPYEGDYNIESSINIGPGNGTMQASIDDGTPLPFSVDGYAAQAGTASAYYGARHLTAGNHKFVFTVTGKNSSSSGYQLALTNLVLGPSHGVGPRSALDITGPASPQLTVPATVGVDAGKSFPGQSAIATYTFDFGDGTPPTTGTATTASHTYTSGGDFVAKVTVTDVNGASGTSTKILTVIPAAPTTLTSSDGTTATSCSTNASAAPTVASLSPVLSATVGTGLSGQFEVRDLTDPSVGPPIAIGDANSTGSPGPTSTLQTVNLTNGHEYAFAARAFDGGNVVSAVSATCYFWAITSGSKAAPTGAVGLPLDNTIYPASSPQTWAGPKSTLKWANGSLALYRNSDNSLLWSAVNGSASNVLVLQNDGNITIYDTQPSITSAGKVNGTSLWSTNTAGQGATSMLLATDGSLTVRAGTTPLWDAPQLHEWPLNEGKGTTAGDRSFDGALTAAVSGGASLAPGGYGTFNSSSGYAATTTAAIDTTKSFTVAAWVNVDHPAGYQTFVTQQGNQVGGFQLEYENNGTDGNTWNFARATSDTANSSFVRVSSAPGAKTDTWVHLIGTWDATTNAMSLYVNGQLAATGFDTRPIASSGPLIIGHGFYNGAANNYVGGGIADVRAYQTALTSDLASALYQNTGFTPPTGLTWALSTPTGLTSSSGTPAACSTNPASPTISTSLTPTLGATLADASWHADFEVRDFTDPSVVAPLYYGASGASTAAGTSVSLGAPSLVNGHEYAFAARAVDGSGAKSANTNTCYLRVSVSGQAATPGTGAVGAFLDNTVYPASAGPITWSGPLSNLVWQTDGNLMVYTKTGQAIWSSNTAGHPGASLALQSDGNLVIRPSIPLMDASGALYGSALWSSGTAGKSYNNLVVQAGGNVVLQSNTGSTYSVSSSTSAGGFTVLAPSGVIASYRVQSDGNVWGTNQYVPGGSWAPWTQMTTNGGFTGIPQVVQASNGVLAIFVRRTDGTLWGASQHEVSGPFTGWGNINGGGGSIVTDPTVVRLSNGILVAYVTAADGNVWGAQQYVLGGTWTPWALVTTGGGAVGKPTVVMVNGMVSIYARKSDGTVWGTSQHQVSGPFDTWVNINGGGGSITSDPTVILTNSGVLAAYVTASDGSVWGTQQYVPGGTWAPWSQLSTGGGYVGDVQVLQTGAGLISLYFRTTNGDIYGTSQQTSGGAFIGWNNVNSGGVHFVGDPMVMLLASGIVAIYAPGADGKVYGTNQYVVGGNFTPWAAVGS